MNLLLILQTLFGLGLELFTSGPLKTMHRPKDYQAQLQQFYEDGRYQELDL